MNEIKCWICYLAKNVKRVKQANFIFDGQGVCKEHFVDLAVNKFDLDKNSCKEEVEKYLKEKKK